MHVINDVFAVLWGLSLGQQLHRQGNDWQFAGGKSIIPAALVLTLAGSGEILIDGGHCTITEKGATRFVNAVNIEGRMGQNI